jgi:hypothetical protein
MNRAGQVLAFLAVPAVAIGVSGSVWAGVIIATLEFGFWGLTRHLRSARHQAR